MEEEMDRWDFYVNGIMHFLLLAYAVGVYHYVFEYKDLWNTASKLDTLFIVAPVVFSIVVMVFDVVKFHVDRVDWSEASVNVFDGDEDD